MASGTVPIDQNLLTNIVNNFQSNGSFSDAQAAAFSEALQNAAQNNGGMLDRSTVAAGLHASNSVAQTDNDDATVNLTDSEFQDIADTLTPTAAPFDPNVGFPEI